MRILFIGSVPDNPYQTDPDIEEQLVGQNQELWKAAAELGRAAAKRGHTIVVGSDRRTTIDYHVVTEGLFPEARAESDPDRKFFLEVFRPNDLKRPYEEGRPPNVVYHPYTSRPGFPGERKVAASRPVGDDSQRTPLWTFAHQSAIENADVVITVAGGHGTERAVYTAENVRVPVLPVKSFGGGSARVHAEVKSGFTNHPLWHHLSAGWNDRRAEGIIQLAEAVGQHSYFLSYSHEDIGFCDFVHLAFFMNDRVVLRDVNQLRAGRPVQSKLYEAIGRAETFVLLWGTTSAQSEWCQKELEVGLGLHERGLPPHRIVLFLRDDIPIPGVTDERRRVSGPFARFLLGVRHVFLDGFRGLFSGLRRSSVTVPITSELSKYLHLNAKNRDQADLAVQRVVSEEKAVG